MTQLCRYDKYTLKCNFRNYNEEPFQSSRLTRKLENFDCKKPLF